MKLMWLLFGLLLSINGKAQSIVTTFEKPFSGITTVEIEGSYCNVEVNEISTSEVRLKGEIRSSNHYYLNIHHSVNGSTLKVWVDKPKSNPGDTKGTLVFMVPRRTKVNINNTNGHVLVQSLSGNKHSINTTLGKVTIRNCTSSFWVKTISGSVNASGLKGNLDLTSRLGDHVFKSVTGLVNVKSGNGSLSANGINGNLTTTTTSANQRINNVNGRVDCEAKDGDIALNGVTGNVNAKTVAGDIKIDQVTGALTITSVTGHQTGKGIRLTGHSTFNSSSGNVYLQLSNPKEKLSFYLSSTSGHLKAKGREGRRNLVMDNNGIKVTGKTGAGSQNYY